jgi:heme-degrading monooxygenase HmoA
VIRHVVLFRLAATDAEERARVAAEVRRRLEALVGVVQGLHDLQVRADLGEMDGHWDVALVTLHETRDDFAAYAADPRHREVIAYCDTVVSDRAVVDSDLGS